MEHNFDARKSQIVKGVAILLMMWHHCFLSGRFDGFTISFFPLTEGQVTLFAAFCKICVSLFAFVSGYGLFFSYQKWMRDHTSSSCVRWLWQRYVRTFSGYWLIVVLSWILCGFLDGRPRTIYVRPSRFLAFIYALIDLLGLSKLLGTPSLIGTWWYMSAAFVFIVSVPILYAAMRRFGSIYSYLLLMVIPRMIGGYPGGTVPLSFLPVFGLGMICADSDFFAKVDRLAKNRMCHAALLVGSVILSCVLCFASIRMSNEKFWDLKWDLFPLAFIVCIYLTVSRIPFLNRILEFLGLHSANVFMVHTFIRDTYCRSFVYGRGHFILIMATLLGLSLLVSFTLEGLKKLIRYDRFCAKLEALSFSSAKP